MDNITVKVVEAFQYDAKVENHSNLVWKISWNFDFVYKYAKIILSFFLKNDSKQNRKRQIMKCIIFSYSGNIEKSV